MFSPQATEEFGSRRYANACAGGELRLFCADGVRDVTPAPDRLVVFQARQLEHAVMDTGDSDRYAVSLWLCKE